MHTLTLLQPVNLGKTLGILPAGEWLLHDLNAFEIAQKAPRGAALVTPYPDRLSDNRGLPHLLMRSGAIGDLLMLTPVLAEIYTQRRERIALCCFKHHHSIFNGNTDLIGLVEYPLRKDQAGFYSSLETLENTMESDHSQHATDVFAKALGLQTPLRSYKPIYHVTDEEKAATAKHLFTGRPNIVIQPKASVANRDYPFPLWGQVIHKLEKRGWGVLLVGSKGQIPPLPPQWQSPFVRDLSQLGLTFRESAAVLSQANAFCGVDSAFLHLCHALDIPAVGLFAAFDWKTRTAHAPKTIALTGVGECAPCNWHMHAGKQFPPNKPCSTKGLCVVLAGISPERIVSKIDLLKP
jgi:ADP-heptose:LPS heptosyltransferase